MRYLIALAALSLTAMPALAEDWDFVLINESGKPIKTIELSPAGAATWAPRTLDADEKSDPVVKPKARTTVRFDKPASQCRYDLRATFADDTTQVWSGANICDNSYITLKLAGDKATISAN